MALTERLALLVDARVDGAVKDIKKLAGESAKTDDAAKRLENRGRAIGTAWKVGVGIAAGAALVKMAQLSGKAIEDASALSETVNKVGVVFGAQADKVLKFGDNAAKSIGQSKNQALSAAATFGQFFDAAGLAADAGSDMSLVMVKLASDMASFNDADPSEVLQNLRSGLSGEAEPLRKFGVFLNESAVAAKAAELGLEAVNGKLTDGQKIQARYALILDQTASAQGDFARTSDSLANKQRSATALMEDASAALGEGLLPAQLAVTNALVDAAPAITTVAKATGNMVEAFTSLPGPVQAVVGTVTLASGAFLLLAPRIAETKKALAELNVTSAATKGRLASAAGVLSGPWGAAITAAVTGVGLFWAEQQKAKARVQELTDSLDQQTGAITDNTREIVANRLQQEGVLDAAQELGLSLGTVTEAALGNADAIRILQAAQDAAIQSAREALAAGADDTHQKQDQARAIQEVVAQVGVQSGALSGAKDKTNQLSQATRGLTGATDDNTNSLGPNTDALKENIEAMRQKRSEAIRAANAEINYQASLDDARKSLKENGRNLDITTEKGRANKTALLSLASAWNDLSAREKNSQGARRQAIKQFVDLATQMGMGAEKARNLAQRLFELPKRTVVGLALDTGPAFAALDTFISKASGRRVVVGVGVHAAQARADGGPVTSGEPYLVGEEGPELFVPNTSGRIVPNSTVMRPGGGSVSTHSRSTGGARLDKLAAGVEKATSAVEKHRKAEQDAAKSLRESIRDRIRALREEKRALAESFGKADGVFGSDAVSIDDILNQRATDAASAASLKSSIEALIKKGVSEDVLRELAGSGKSGLAQITALSGASAAQIGVFNKLTQQTNSNLLSAGKLVGGAVLDDDIAREKGKLRRSDRAVADAVEHGIERVLSRHDKNTVVELRIGGHVLRTTLLELKRKSGQSLGLA